MQTLAIAYSIVWIVIFAYILALGNRISRLERELQSIEKVKEETQV